MPGCDWSLIQFTLNSPRYPKEQRKEVQKRQMKPWRPQVMAVVVLC